MSYFDDASLVMIPSGYKTSKVYSVKPTDGTGDLTFTRSNDTATRVGPDGLIEKVRTNLFPTGSALLATGWTSVGATLTAGQTDPNGGTTALRVQLAAGGSPYSYILQSFTGSAFSYARSVFIKGATAQAIRIVDPHSGAGTTVNLTTSYQRFTAVGAGVAPNFGIQFDNNNDAAAKDFTIAFVQIEEGDIATSYIATTSAAVSVGPVANVPRLDYLGSSCPRLLLEGQRQNLALFSESFDNAAWTKSNATISANAATSPDGYTNADKLIPSNGASLSSISNYALQSITKAASAIQYTYSTFVKQDGLNRVNIIAQGASIANNASATFSLVNGSIATAAAAAGTFTGASASVTDYGNGWYRCALVFTTNTDTALTIRNIPTDSTLTTGNGTNGILIYGAALEQGAYATSYIPTLGAAVTRGADACSKAGISSLIGQTEGTIFVDFVMSNNATDMVPFDIAGSDGKLIWIRNAGAQFYGNGTTLIASIETSAKTQGTRYKVAFVYGQNDFRLYRNGSLIGTDTSGTFTGTFSDIALNSVVNQANLFNQVLIFKTKLTNAQLAELTTI